MSKENEQNSEKRLDAIVLKFIEAQTRGEALDIDEFVKHTDNQPQAGYHFEIPGHPGAPPDHRKRPLHP